MHDVNLNFFKDKKNFIFQLKGGTTLYYDEGCLRTSSGNRVVLLSKDKRKEIESWNEKGYHITAARISCILAWKGKDDNEESAVILPDLVLQKLSSN